MFSQTPVLEPKRFSLSQNLAFAVLFVSLLSVSSLYSYLLFHTFVEVLIIAILFATFTVTWHGRRFENGYLLIVGISSSSVLVLETLHMLTYKGLEVLPGFGTNLPTQLWLALRFVQSLSLLFAPLFIDKKTRIGWVFASYLLVSTTLVFLIFSGLFPEAYIEGAGLTPFKIWSEYLISAILCGALFLLWDVRKRFARPVLEFLLVSIAISIPAELAFTTYFSVYGPANLIGHLFSLVSSYFLYLAIVETGISRPYQLLFWDLNHANEKLRGAIRTRDEVLSVVAHDLKNPLFSIMLNSDFVAEFSQKKALPEVIARTAGQIKRSGKRMEKMINDILDVAVIETGGFKPKIAVEGVQRILNDAVELMWPLAAEKEIDLRLTPPRSGPGIDCDRDRIVQVLSNLIGNAIKFTPSGGSIVLEATEESGTEENRMVRFSVSDTGTGIPKERLPYVFDRFWQAEESAKQGSGLGLAISKGIVEAHQGKIWVESTVDQGSTFYFTLPSRQAKQIVKS